MTHTVQGARILARFVIDICECAPDWVMSDYVAEAIEKVKTQKGIQIEHTVVDGANHFFDGKVDVLMSQVGTYLDRMVGPEIIKSEQESV